MGERSEEGQEKEGEEVKEGDRDCRVASGREECTKVLKASVEALADCARPACDQFGRSEGD
jgi:hypothetical protein